jgi:stress response protein SCP2
MRGREQEARDAAFDAELKEVVLGLHWTPPEESDAKSRGEEPANLDAFCVLFDGKQRVLEVVHPGRPRNANGSVVHTGDSRTGASTWDDERIFVFLKALPEAVAAIAFAVAIVNGRTFGEVRGASCHVSDAATEREMLRVELTPLGPVKTHCVATLQRCLSGWEMHPGAPRFDGVKLQEIVAACGGMKP